MGTRSRWKLVALGAAVCVLVTASCSSSEAPDGLAASSPRTNGTYLALGDSVPFGSYDGAGDAYEDADNFVGYPQLVGAQLGLAVSNAACPGETTVSFRDGGCGYRESYPLHVSYGSAGQPQLDFALEKLAELDDVELVTVQLGANDAFECQRSTRSRCTDATDVQAFARSVQSNLDSILSALREKAGYGGQLVVVTYYVPNSDEAFGQALRTLDEVIDTVARAHDAAVADGYEAFREKAETTAGDTVEAGLVYPNDVHPTDAGQRVLADAVLAVVD
ncbi:Lysophospholipase L1 [Blastococcus tunisiensis]|uniref:Lysophospholipase L1 n=1 Tax=Blastococcus tunisiensis TaxID=1798228 RepID=A0A1I1YKF2_9ACTN|nr:Lysophospholipase L1 [Blastococcus sp. DSM 46838]